MLTESYAKRLSALLQPEYFGFHISIRKALGCHMKVENSSESFSIFLNPTAMNCCTCTWMWRLHTSNDILTANLVDLRLMKFISKPGCTDHSSPIIYILPNRYLTSDIPSKPFIVPITPPLMLHTWFVPTKTAKLPKHCVALNQNSFALPLSKWLTCFLLYLMLYAFHALFSFAVFTFSIVLHFLCMFCVCLFITKSCKASRITVLLKVCQTNKIALPCKKTTGCTVLLYAPHTERNIWLD